jgi:hypothetical protein
MTSTIKVNTIQNQCGQNIINENSNTITLGASGDTVTLASGASQTGFGRTGTVNWQTSIKTAATFTAVNGEGYFVDTSSNAITVTLPAGTAGSIVAFKDYAENFDTNKLTITANGSQKINGDATLDLEVSTAGESLTLVYADDTKGWLVVNDGNNDAGSQAQFIAATGGTITTCGNFKIHTFTGPGTFTVTCAGGPSGSNKISYVVVGGGSAGGFDRGGGGGAGGFREGRAPAFDSYSASPLVAPDGLPVTATGYPVTVGAGSAVSNTGDTPISNGSNSVFAGSSTITAAGGGGAGNPGPSNHTGKDGGSGGGARDGSNSGGSGNTPAVSPPQGNPGGSGNSNHSGPGGGGGGATQSGFDGAGNPSTPTMGDGGDGATTSINGSPTTFAGGGGSGGGGSIPAGGVGGNGGGGNGASQPGPASSAGTANTGGGGGAGNGASDSGNNTGSAGGSGIVIIRYKFQ